MSFFSPRLLATLKPRFPDGCVIRSLVTDVASDDETNPEWQSAAGLDELRAVVSPGALSVNDPHFSETIGSVFFVDILGAHEIPEDAQVVVITAGTGVITTYRVLAIQPDGVGLSTRLLCKKFV